VGDAEQANTARSLKSIDLSLKKLANVMEALNENFVAFVKKLDQADIVIEAIANPEALAKEVKKLIDEEKNNEPTQ
jgi:hypothetical protein